MWYDQIMSHKCSDLDKVNYFPESDVLRFASKIDELREKLTQQSIECKDYKMSARFAEISNALETTKRLVFNYADTGEIDINST